MAWPITAATEALLRSAHVVRTTAVVTDSLGAYTAELIAGAVSLDGSSMVRTTASLELPPAVWDRAKRWPLEAARVSISYGIGPLDGSTAVVYVPFGGLFVEKVSRNLPGGSVKVDCSDYMRFVEYATILFSTVVPSNYRYRDAILMLMNASSGFTLNADPASDWGSNPLVPAGFYLDRSEPRLSYIKQIMDALNSKIWINRSGLYQVERLDTFASAPVWRIDAGASGVLLSSEDSRSGTETRNTILVISEPADGTAPTVAVAQDADPLSPTYIGGLFGVRSYIRASGFLTDAAAMTALARSLLLLQLGLSRSVTATIPPAPHLDPGDLISLTLPGEFPELRKIANVTVDLAGGPTEVELVEHRV